MGMTKPVKMISPRVRMTAGAMACECVPETEAMANMIDIEHGREAGQQEVEEGSRLRFVIKYSVRLKVGRDGTSRALAKGLSDRQRSGGRAERSSSWGSGCTRHCW